MKNSSYRRVLYFIGGVILITLCIQVYWNYKNYQQGRQQLLNEVQISLDNAIEKYYAAGTQKSTRITLQHTFEWPVTDLSKMALSTDTLVTAIKRETIGLVPGTRFEQVKIQSQGKPENLEDIKVFGSSHPVQLDSLVGRILFSMVNDTLNLRKNGQPYSV